MKLEGKIELTSLGNLIQKEKLASFSKYFSYFILTTNLLIILFFFSTAIFTSNTIVLNQFYRLVVVIAALGILTFFISLKVNKADPKSNLLIQSSFVFIYILILLEATGGSKSVLFPILFLFLILSAFYSMIVGSFVFVVSLAYLFFSAVYLKSQFPSTFFFANFSNILTLVSVAIFANFLGYFYRKTLVDKSKLEKYTKNVSAEKSKDDAIFSNIGDGIYAVNTKREMIMFNPEAEKITGWKSKETLGLSCKKIMNFKNEQSVSICEKDCPALAVWNTGENVVRDDLCFLKKREKIRLEGTYAPIKDMDGKVTGAICVFRDITKKKEVERMRSEFVSTASHELRTPITTMSGYIELAMNKSVCQVDDKAREYLGKAFNTAGAMSNLIKNLLVLTKIEDKKLTLDITSFPIKDLSLEVLEIFQNRAQEKNVKLKYLSSPNLTVKGKVVGRSLNVRADREQVKEVLTNLVENAIKFTENGEITISIEYDEDFAKVCVADNGVGIPDDSKEHLFEKFYQVDNSATRKVGGTGLGLYITRSIVENFGGQIWVESEEKKGSKFSFTIPRSID